MFLLDVLLDPEDFFCAQDFFLLVLENPPGPIQWDAPMFVLDDDIHKAYDYTKHDVCVDALHRKNAPDIVIACLLRQNRRTSFIFQLGLVELPPIHRTRSLPQGDPVMPKITY